MTRRNAQLPWTSSGGGLYGGGNKRNYGQLIVLGVIVLAVIGLGYFLFQMAFGGGEDCKSEYCASGQEIPAPAGYELVTKVYQYNDKLTVPAGTDINISVPLSKATTDARNLSFYRYDTDMKSWEPITAALLDGSQVRATLHDTPNLLAVLRRNSPGGEVVAYLPHTDPAATLHPDAVGKITILHTLDFTPDATGAVAGELSTIHTDNSFRFIPQIQAGNNIQGSVQIVQGLLSSAGSRSAHVQNIANKVAETGVAGIDISYQDLTVNERSSFTLFISELASVLHGQQKQLTLTLPPPLKTADHIDEGAYDWAELGKVADVVQMMPFRDQGKYRTDVPEILQYLTARVQPATKLVLTVSPYATEKSPEGFKTLTLAQAMNIATQLQIRTGADKKITTNTVVDVVGVNINKVENRSGIIWDPNTATVAFTYEDNGVRSVWLENFFSIGFKLELISRFKLGGVAVEDASSDVNLGNIWTALVPYISSGQATLLQPNPDDLKPVWEPSAGTFEDGGRGSIKWNTPAEPNTYTIKLTLSDGVARFQSETSANVQARTAATPVATATAGR